MSYRGAMQLLFCRPDIESFHQHVNLTPRNYCCSLLPAVNLFSFILGGYFLRQLGQMSWDGWDAIAHRILFRYEENCFILTEILYLWKKKGMETHPELPFMVT